MTDVDELNRMRIVYFLKLYDRWLLDGFGSVHNMYDIGEECELGVKDVDMIIQVQEGEDAIELMGVGPDVTISTYGISLAESLLRGAQKPWPDDPSAI